MYTTPPTPSIYALQPFPDFLRISYSSPHDTPHTLDFHYPWLRHRCLQSVHPLTGERTLCPSDVPPNISPARVFSSHDPSHDASLLHILWDTPDEHLSTFPLPWLIDHAYAVDLPLPPLLPSSLSEVLVPSSDSITSISERLFDKGLVIVRGWGTDTEALIDALSTQGLHIRGTHFGRIEDLRTDNTTNQNTDQLGYTNAAINLHTDQPFIPDPPRFQLLHCMQRATSGGDNAIVDAIAAAHHLSFTDAPTFDLLASTPVHFHRQQKQFERLHISPIFERDSDGHLYRVRYSYFTMAPQRLPFAHMSAWYHAYNRFASFVRDPRNQYQVTLEPGDFLAYDNWRMLHARTAFSGPRWMRGVYFDPVSPDPAPPAHTLFPTQKLGNYPPL